MRIEVQKTEHGRIVSELVTGDKEGLSGGRMECKYNPKRQNCNSRCAGWYIECRPFELEDLE